MRRFLPITFLCLSGLACAADDDITGWQLTWDNDVWGRGHTDRWYTNGTRVSWTFGQAPGNRLTRAFLDATESLLGHVPNPTMSYSVGQTMYTPQDITQAGPQPNDRPWGAFLYFSLTAHAYRDDEFRATELKLGTTGRYALGEQVQKLVHRVTSSPRPLGWDKQLRSRPGIQFTHARVHRLGDTPANDLFGFQWGWGVGAGTLRVRGSMDVAMIVGDLRGRNAPLLVGNEGDFVAQDFTNRDQYRSPYFFIAANVTGVAYNYFIEGPTPYGRSALEPRRSYGVINAGLSLPLQVWLGPSWPRLVYSQSARTPEFKSDTTSRQERTQRWGTLSFQWDLK